jgi:hypothetical protein
MRLTAAALGRLVLNHSTHAEGLIAALELVAKNSSLISTIVPGRIARSVGQTTALTLKVGPPLAAGGFKVRAQRGSSVQEVFLRTSSAVQDTEVIALELERCVGARAVVLRSGRPAGST